MKKQQIVKNNMNLNIDIDNKTIRVLDNPKLGDLLIELENLFPEGQWAEYKLEHRPSLEANPPTINIPWVQPMPLMPVEPYFPYYGKWEITCNDTSNHQPVCTTTSSLKVTNDKPSFTVEHIYTFPS